jgi:hypothetical protein
MPASTYDAALLDEEAYKASHRTSAAEKTAFLLDAIGPRVTAAALGLSDARPLYKWRTGEVEPRNGEQGQKLQILYRIGYEVTKAYGPKVLSSFLRGSNPQLGDRAPLVVLAQGEANEVENELVGATRAFLEG